MATRKKSKSKSSTKRTKPSLWDWLTRWNLTSLKINAKFASLEFKPSDADREAAWELYVEMLTRIVTQRLESSYGDEKTALDSIYSLFATTRQILRTKGREASEFTKVSIVVLNQIVRPFTAKWHRESLQGAFDNEAQCKVFRTELEALRQELCNYTQALAHLARVEDLTELEDLGTAG